MLIEIQTRNFPLTKALRGHIQRRLDFALSTRHEHIERILVTLSDINGPRGGADKCCQIQIILPRLKDVVIEDIESDLYDAINRAADRASRTVARKISRERDKNLRLTLVHSISDNIKLTEFSSR